MCGKLVLLKIDTLREIGAHSPRRPLEYSIRKDGRAPPHKRPFVCLSGWVVFLDFARPALDFPLTQLLLLLSKAQPRKSGSLSLCSPG